MQTPIEIRTTIHLSGTTYQIEDNFKRLLESKFIEQEQLGLVTILYKTKYNNIENGPVRLFFTNGTAVYLNLTAGYDGNGPHTTCNILSMFNIPGFNEDDILLPQEVVNICYKLKKDIDFVCSSGV